MEVIIKSKIKSFFNLVSSLEELPTIGNKSAVRLAYYISVIDKPLGLKLANAIEESVQNIVECKACRAISENELCDICIDEDRDDTILCIVETSKDLFYIEESKAFNGRYFVLLDTVQKKDFTKLENMVKNGIKEIIFALTPSASNDAVMILIEDRLKKFDLKFTKIARGVPTGISLQNVDILSIISSFKSKIDV